MAEECISKKLKDAPNKNERTPVHVNEGYNKGGSYTLSDVPENYKSNSDVNLQKDPNHFKGYTEIKV